MSVVEEYFAPNAHSDVEIVEEPAKRYATRSKNHEKIVKELKIENLHQIKTKLKAEEEEQIRYLSLDNATKDVEILELKEKIKHLEESLKPVTEYENAIESVCSNIKTYENLCNCIPTKNYKELIKMELELIKKYTIPSVKINNLPKTFNALKCMYANAIEKEESISEVFHRKLFWNAIVPNNIVYRILEFIVGLIVLIIMLYIIYIRV
jgi:hypothetical protein